jgi:transcriptional regulator with PAS, ATPase and Fis domain
VLEDREYYPVGGEKPERTEARVIAATHRDLESMIGEGRFREDLYYRLRVVEIRFANVSTISRSWQTTWFVGQAKRCISHGR